MNLSRYFRLLAATLALCLGALSADALAVTPMVSAGRAHTVAVKSDGTLVAWGSNEYGQRGDGTTNQLIPWHKGIASRTMAIAASAGNLVLVQLTPSGWQLVNNDGPKVVPYATGVVAVSAGEYHTVALKSDGTVLAWGSNEYGQLGDGIEMNRSSPVAVPGLTGVVAVAAGEYHTVALKSDGTVLAWGGGGFYNYGQLGDGTTTDRSSPVAVPGLTGVVAVAAGIWHTVALKSDGTVVAWGLNNYGQLGDGTTTNRSSPVAVQGLTGVVAVSAGRYDTVALKSDGTVVVWGNNWYVLTTTARSSPVAVQGLTGVVAVEVGSGHTVALKSDGTVVAWGWNYKGQLGDGTTMDRSSPAAVPGLTGVVAVSAGSAHTVALKSDGTVLAWGWSQHGQLGDGTLGERHSPVLVANTTVDGFLNLLTGTTTTVHAKYQIPFFVAASGGITDTSASVTVATKFNAADIGKSGQVFVTAMVPQSSLGTTLAMAGQSVPDVGVASRTMANTATSTFVPVQLTPTGWQPVVKGQLIPYATGVLGDQLAAQSILNGVSTTNLKGSEFCVGYGTSASEMNSAGRLRAVATIPDPAGASTATCDIGISNVRLYAYAEANYPSFFSGTTADGQALQYSYRAYPATENYLVIDDSRVLNLYGTYTGNVLTHVGPLESLKSYITTWEATQ